MNKLISLIKVSLNHDMNIFKLNTKKQTTASRLFLPIFLTLDVMFVFGLYSSEMMKVLKPVHLEFVVLSIFAASISLITLIEGVYKSGPLLFNCKDDQLLLSLPIKKQTILFIRMFKFYAFEFLYNSLFLIPVMFIYAVNVNPGWTYYLVSIISLFVLPIIPILLSCLIGFVTTYLSSHFKGKNFFQIIFTMVFIFLTLYSSYNLEGFMSGMADKATGINNAITSFYYPVKAYVSLVLNFDIVNLLLFILIHIALFAVTIFVLGKVYFKINSKFKGVLIKHSKKNSNYVIKKRSKLIAFVRKEFNRFVSTPVFITNAGFGLFLFLIACVYASIKYDFIIEALLKSETELNIETITTQLPVIMFGLVCATSFMTSITSSMISLECKSFNILKSLPVKPFKIVFYKIMAALTIMLPCILIGDLIVFIRFRFDILSILLILIASILMPFLSELIGIMVNLKYPKLDATNDTEIVKQSMSSMIAVFIGMGLFGVTLIAIFMLLETGISSYIIMLLFLVIFGLVTLVLWNRLLKNCDKSFNNIVT